MWTCEVDKIVNHMKLINKTGTGQHITLLDHLTTRLTIRHGLFFMWLVGSVVIALVC